MAPNSAPIGPPMAKPAAPPKIFPQIDMERESPSRIPAHHRVIE
jgi:hypothetical protein